MTNPAHTPECFAAHIAPVYAIYPDWMRRAVAALKLKTLPLQAG